MDRRVKERLVGASILVVLIVLIVPELLSGPVPAPATARLPVSAPEPVRNVTVDLSTSKTQAAEAASVPDTLAASSTPGAGTAGSSTAGAGTAGAGTAAPSAAASGAASSAPPTIVPTTSAPLENTRPSPTSVATPAKSVARHWAVQLGSFASHENADKLARQLKAQGFAVYVLPGGSGSAVRYRVRVGPMADRGAAAQTAAKLKTLGQTASLVAPAR
jgi:DedD protein